MRSKRKFYHFGNVVKQIRRENKLTQQEFSKLLKVHAQYVSNVERGLSDFSLKATKRFVQKFPNEWRAISGAIRADYRAECDEHLEEIFN